MVLAQNERVVRKWEYAGSANRNATLTVTNKRIVHTAQNANTVEYQEIPVASVKSISIRRTSPFIVGVILMILAAVLVIAALGMLASEVIPAALVFFVYAIVLFAIGIWATRICTVILVISTEGYTDSSLSVGMFGLFIPKQFTGTVRLRAHRSVVDSIIKELGALIISIKDEKNIPEAENSPL